VFQFCHNAFLGNEPWQNGSSYHHSQTPAWFAHSGEIANFVFGFLSIIPKTDHAIGNFNGAMKTHSAKVRRYNNDSEA
jgi:hypothetical protein